MTETHNPGFDPAVEQTGINVVRALTLDAVEKAKSGHQGTAMALAPTAHVLFTRIMNYDPSAPDWPDRDRFVLSAGHASMLLYSFLHLTGYDLSLDDLKEFRQWGSKTPGHPEAGHTPGVEVTTGPLGQGIANAVGLATVERQLRTEFGADLCDHYTYVIAGDGDLSEGVSHEAASLAGHLGLGHLIAVYDDNHVTIDGPTELALDDDAPQRFRAYGWHVIEIGEKANDLDAITAAFAEAKAETDRPSLIVLRSEIGYPSPEFTGNPKAHGNPFDAAEIAETKKVMGLDPDATFAVPDDVAAMYRAAGERGAETRRHWEKRLADSPMRNRWETQWQASHEIDIPVSFSVGEKIATRVASQQCVTAIDEIVPGLLGGSADLTGNTGTKLSADPQGLQFPGGRQIHFGVREHAMGSFLVGAAQHGGVIPFGGTFLVFADYMRPAVRLAALSGARCVFVWTHDSVGVGEDGPTHQPIEQIMSLRAIPNLNVIRPADAKETAGAWQIALADDEGPTAIILSRQGLPVLEHTDAAKVFDGAYLLSESDDAVVTLVGTGSEVWVCVEAAERLAADGIVANVVSMPSWELFDLLDDDEQDAVLKPDLPVVSLEAGITLGWDRYADYPLGVDRFGASAPGDVVLEKLGISADHVIEAVSQLLED